MTQHQRLLIIDFGSQVTQLIARRLRELNVYCEIRPYQAVTDALVVLQHIGKITDREVAQLAEMLEAFEKRAPRRPRGCR